MTVQLFPVRHVLEVRDGDDLTALLLAGLDASRLTLLDGDVLVVTQKVVSKAEGRVVPEGARGKRAWVQSEARRVVARRGDLVIAETRHGFVCANAGVDSSNVPEGFLSLLPVDPDGSAERLRAGISAATGADVAVVITDTFGRPWRHGLVNVAIGCAGVPSLIDLRGTKDATGRVLEVTVEALADELAAASGLVVGKADGVPACVIRGARLEGPPIPARALVRGAAGDLFHHSILQAILARLDSVAFDGRNVDRGIVDEALAAMTAPPGGDRLVVMGVEQGPSRRRLLAAITADDQRRTAADAPLLLVALLPVPDEVDDENTALLRGGGAVQNAMLAFHARGLGSHWIPPSSLDLEIVAAALGFDADRLALLGAVVAGWPAEDVGT